MRSSLSVLRVTAAAALALLLPNAAGAAQAPLDNGAWLSMDVVARPLALHTLVPADEYFGEQRLSLLGVRSIINAMKLEGTSPLALPMQLERIEGVRQALAGILVKYPDEPWLPREMYAFAEFLMSKQRPYTDALAEGYLNYLSLRYPSRSEGQKAAALLSTYNFMPFDMSEAPMPDPHESVTSNLFPPLRLRAHGR